MPIDLNMLLGLPPANPRAISPLSAAMLTPGNDIGQVGPSSPRMGPDSEDYIGEVGPVPEHLRNWTGGSVQGMPVTENIGEVGPPGPQATPKSDMAAFGPLTSTQKSARLPMPLGFDEMAQKREQTGTGGAAGQAKPEDVAQAGKSVTPAAAAPKPSVNIAELERKKAMATVLAEKGTPAQRVRGKLTLYEVERELKKIEEGQAEAKQLDIIDTSIAEPDAKSKATTLAKLGAKTNEIAEALGFDDKGVARQKERTEKLDAYVGARANDARVGSTMQQAAKRAFKLIDDHWLATGTPGAVTGMLPGTSASNLRLALAPIQANIGFDRLQQMREQSKTGGALGSIAVKELEFLQAVQGSLDITQDPKTLKENIAAIVKSQQIFANMRKLVPGLEAGDPQAIEAYATLSSQLGTLDADVSRIMATKPKVPPRPQGADDAAILADAQKQIAAGRDKDVIARRLMEWGVKF